MSEDSEPRLQDPWPIRDDPLREPTSSMCYVDDEWQHIHIFTRDNKLVVFCGEVLPRTGGGGGSNNHHNLRMLSVTSYHSALDLDLSMPTSKVKIIASGSRLWARFPSESDIDYKNNGLVSAAVFVCSIICGALFEVCIGQNIDFQLELPNECSVSLIYYKLEDRRLLLSYLQSFVHACMYTSADSEAPWAHDPSNFGLERF